MAIYLNNDSSYQQMMENLRYTLQTLMQLRQRDTELSVSLTHDLENADPEKRASIYEAALRNPAYGRILRDKNFSSSIEKLIPATELEKMQRTAVSTQAAAQQEALFRSYLNPEEWARERRAGTDADGNTLYDVGNLFEQMTPQQANELVQVSAKNGNLANFDKDLLKENMQKAGWKLAKEVAAFVEKYRSGAGAERFPGVSGQDRGAMAGQPYNFAPATMEEIRRVANVGEGLARDVAAATSRGDELKVTGAYASQPQVTNVIADLNDKILAAENLKASLTGVNGIATQVLNENQARQQAETHFQQSRADRQEAMENKNAGGFSMFGVPGQKGAPGTPGASGAPGKPDVGKIYREQQPDVDVKFLTPELKQLGISDVKLFVQLPPEQRVRVLDNIMENWAIQRDNLIGNMTPEQLKASGLTGTTTVRPPKGAYPLGPIAPLVVEKGTEPEQPQQPPEPGTPLHPSPTFNDQRRNIVGALERGAAGSRAPQVVGKNLRSIGTPEEAKQLAKTARDKGDTALYQVLMHLSNILNIEKERDLALKNAKQQGH